MSERTRRAETVAAKIEAQIDRKNLPVGTLIGSEPELCEKYGISRGVFREAARLLEHYMVAQTKEGRGGGLVVAEPDVGTVATSAARLLRRMRAEPTDLAEARLTVEIACARLATERATEEEIQELKQSVVDAPDDNKKNIDEFHTGAVEFHLAIARMSRNPGLILFAEILAILTQQRVAGRYVQSMETARIRAAHQKMIDAIAARDAEAAEAAVREHFRQMVESWGERQSFTGLNAASFG